MQQSYPCRHVVQFEPDGQRLTQSVSRYLSEGLRQSDGALVLAASDHITRIASELARLGVDVDAATRDRRLLLRDANEILPQIIVDGQPDWQVFESTVKAFMRDIRAQRRGSHVGLRVYGELVGILWQSGNIPAALRVEQFWNRLLTSISFDLFCGYPVGLNNHGSVPPDLATVIRAHTHVVGGDGDHSPVRKPATKDSTAEIGAKTAPIPVFG